MRTPLPERLEAGRVREGTAASDPSWGPYGSFRVQGPCGARLTIVASGGDYPVSAGWEHVSVSTPTRCPNWPEMSFVKDLFWREDEAVAQFHPPKSDYINNMPYCLHLWRHVSLAFPMPPSILVGMKDRGVMTVPEARREWLKQAREA
jgi:hypothetical protein